MSRSVPRRLSVVESPGMTLEEYRQRRSSLDVPPKAREHCLRCRKPRVSCYCEDLFSIETDPRFVILMHPLEDRHPVGTGRMTHRCLGNSALWVGVNFTEHEGLNLILKDPALYPVLLFPGPKSTNLSTLAPADRAAIFPKDRKVVVILLDATWELAQKMLHVSTNLQSLPRIGFTPERLSGFLVRKQPKPECFSTIEAAHELLRLLSTSDGAEANDAQRPFDQLLTIFQKMVQKQLAYRVRGIGQNRHSQSYINRKLRRQKWREEKKRLAERAQSDSMKLLNDKKSFVASGI